MTKINYFEEIEAWKYARVLSQKIYNITRTGSFSRDFGLKDQIRRAAVSVSSNIAEGFERNSKNEFLYFLSIAKGSGGEVKSLLYIALDEGYISQSSFDDIAGLVDKTNRLIGGLMRYLKKSEIKGSRYKK
ncbi:MAG: four helix bundle protein [Rhodothermales bacterium]